MKVSIDDRGWPVLALAHRIAASPPVNPEFVRESDVDRSRSTDEVASARAAHDTNSSHCDRARHLRTRGEASAAPHCEARAERATRDIDRPL